MSSELRVTAVLFACALAPALATATTATVPMIDLVGAAAPARVEAPPPRPGVVFSIPRYSLTNTERETIATCLILEAASQGDLGMRGVMSVIRNRARGQPELFATTVLRPKQFSAFNAHTAGRESLARLIARAKRDRMWPAAVRLVEDAVNEAWHDPTEGATHYTRTGERTRWTHRLALTVRIGAHSFYR